MLSLGINVTRRFTTKKAACLIER